jgi:sulfite reductase (ferredoxin)
VLLGEAVRGGSVVNEGPPISSRTVDHEESPLSVLEPSYLTWARDSVIEHKLEGLAGVHVRVKLGDLTSQRARQLAEVAREFSHGELRISIEQNIYLPWVRQRQLQSLYSTLKEISLADAGVGTVADVTTCPGSDTCRLGIASAKGLGSALGDAFDNGPLVERVELARSLKIKISGCPNGCAQHSVAGIGFYAAALTRDDRTVPAHFVTVGGDTAPDRAQFGLLLGKFPAKNCVNVTQTLLSFYEQERKGNEQFNQFVNRVGVERLKQAIDPLRYVPSFEEDPTFYEDYGHEHERFAVRKGVKGECAGSTVAELVPNIDRAKVLLAQAEALVYHKQYREAALTAYEAAAAAARVPLYGRLVDPFTSEQALWEFENLFVLSGETEGKWKELSRWFEKMKRDISESGARTILDEARAFVAYCVLIARARSAA